MNRAADSAFGDDPEPKGRPLECTLCGSGSHNRSMCPWGAENYRMPEPDQSPARPFLEELAAHLEGQEAPKPTPQLGTQPSALAPEALKRRLAERQALYSAVDAIAQEKQQLSDPWNLRRIWRALKTVIWGST